jgi:hypothetical protein
MDWLHATAIGALGTLAGVWLGGRMTRTTQKEALVSQTKRERSAQFRRLLGEVKVLASDGDPMRVSMSLGPRSVELVEELRIRWRTLWPELEGYALLESDAETRDAASKLTKAMGGVVHWDGWLVSDYERGESWRDAFEQGTKDHAELREAIDSIGELLRRT